MSNHSTPLSFVTSTTQCIVQCSLHPAISRSWFEPPRRRGPAFRDIRQSTTSQRHRTRHGIPTNPFTQLKRHGLRPGRHSGALDTPRRPRSTNDGILCALQRRDRILPLYGYYHRVSRLKFSRKTFLSQSMKICSKPAKTPRL